VFPVKVETFMLDTFMISPVKIGTFMLEMPKLLTAKLEKNPTSPFKELTIIFDADIVFTVPTSITNDEILRLEKYAILPPNVGAVIILETVSTPVLCNDINTVGFKLAI
jgi:hypothetical protein